MTTATDQAMTTTNGQENPTQRQPDVVIIGAGPCGLFQAFQLGLQGISCAIVDASESPGGQCTELYPDKPIYDIPAIPCTRADHLIRDLCRQLEPFDATFHLGHQVTNIEQQQNNFCVTTHQNTAFTPRFVILATGAGAFTPVQLRIDGLERYNDSQIFYNEPDPEALENKALVVTGDSTAAIDTAVRYSSIARQTTFIHRKRRLDAPETMLSRLEQSVASGQIQQLHGKISGVSHQSRVTAVQVTLSSKELIELPVDTLLPRLGTSPKVSPYEQWGIDTIANHVSVDPGTCQSAVSGLFAIGDINTYTGKRKLIVCGFHEATLAAFAIAALVRPDKPVHTLYTTTSTELQKRLGVSK